MAGNIIEYEGLQELLQALKLTELDLFTQIKGDMQAAGNVVRDEARRIFTGGAARSASIQHTADNFETRVRAGGQAKALIIVGQRLRSTTGTRPDYGGYQMRHGLLPARTAKLEEVAHILADSVGSNLRRHGF